MARYQIVFSHCCGMFSLDGQLEAAVCYCLNSIWFSHCCGMFSLDGQLKAAVCYCLNSIWFSASLRHISKRP